MNFQVYKLMCDIVNQAYSQEDYPNNRFTKFYIEIKQKEMKTVHGRYFRDQRRIEIFNMSRPNGHIVKTTIHEVAHHIDYEMRGSSDHSIQFYEIMKHLLVTAIGMGVMTKNDLLTARDSADTKRLIGYFGDIHNWTILSIFYKPEESTIRVKQSYPIRNLLSARGYHYSSIHQAWEKTLAADLEKELTYLRSITQEENIEVSSSKELSFDSYYYICVFNSYSHKEKLKELGYVYNGYGFKKKSWNKKVVSKELNKEKSMLSDFSGIDIKVYSR